MVKKDFRSATNRASSAFSFFVGSKGMMEELGRMSEPRFIGLKARLSADRD
jgi:hypothetical protein